MLLRRYHAVKAVEKAAFTDKKEDNKRKFSKSDISRMSTDDLKAFAPTLGIEVTEKSTGAKLKEEIIAKLGL